MLFPNKKLLIGPAIVLAIAGIGLTTVDFESSEERQDREFIEDLNSYNIFPAYEAGTVEQAKMYCATMRDRDDLLKQDYLVMYWEYIGAGWSKSEAELLFTIMADHYCPELY